MCGMGSLQEGLKCVLELRTGYVFLCERNVTENR